jgi:hypothetical protein
VTIHPNVFHAVLERVPVAAWQVVEEPDSLRVLLAQPTDQVVDDDVSRDVSSALAQAGADNVRVKVERVQAIPRTALGKSPLVRAIRPERLEDPHGFGQSSISASDGPTSKRGSELLYNHC